MANILKSLGDAMERQQQRRRETNMEILRAIYTRPGMIVLGTILLIAALAFIWPQIAPEDDNTNTIVIDMDDILSNEEAKRAVQEMVKQDEEWQRQDQRWAAIVFGLGAAACYVRAILPWKKREAAETISDDSASKETEEIPASPKPVENSAAPSAETDSREDRLENLKRLYEAGILSREEYDERRKKL